MTSWPWVVAASYLNEPHQTTPFHVGFHGVYHDLSRVLAHVAFHAR
jgi:hypothetical protein